MTVIMATVGFTSAKVQPIIDVEDEKEELVLFYDRDAEGRSRKAAEELQSYVQPLNVDVRFVEVSAFDLVPSCLLIRQEIKKRAGKDIVVGISGGARVLVSAALLASILEGVRVVHINEKSNAVEPLPLLRLEAGEVLNDKQRRVLRHIRDHPGCAQREVAKALSLTKGTVSHHVQALKRQGLIRAEHDEGDSRSQRLQAVPSADLLLME